MICAPNHEDAVIVLQAVNFVQKIASHILRNDSVEIFKHKIARSELPGFGEDFIDGKLRSPILSNISIVL